MTSPVFGVYYGNSTAGIAVYREDGRIDIIANDAGDRATATSVYISNNEKVVGLATGGNVSRLSCTVTRNKCFLESCLSDERLDSLRSGLAVKVERSAGGVVSYRVQDGDSSLSITPLEVATLIFTKLLSIGRSVANEGRLRCVLAVPHWWDPRTRESVQMCAQQAGWSVLQLVSESSASLLAYLPTAHTSNMLGLVYRVGGYSCEATVIRLVSGYFQILGSERRDKGVRDVIDIVCKHHADEFRRKTKLEPTESRKCMSKLWSSSESMVRTLSSLPTASLYLESLCEGVDFTAVLSRARLDSLLTGVIPQLVQPIHKLLSALDLQPQQIDKVVCCGAGLNIPRLRTEVASIFCGNTELCDYLQPQEVVAVGAASQAGLLATAFPVSQPLPGELASTTVELRLLTSPLNLKLSTGEEVKLEGALPLSKSITVNLDENSSTLEVHASQHNLTANTKFEGFDSTPTPLRVTLELSEKSLQVQVVDLSTNLSQTSPLILSVS